ncbi:MAG: carbon storage regulator [Oscillospiraceae bacterium]|nr:carbon storage regulator [Oscillospiraceae bacterium]
MLVITRKKDEGFVVGDNIKITVVEIVKDRVKIGIDAPTDVKIVRNELYDTERFNMQAAVNKPSANILAKFMSDENSDSTK